MPVQRISVRALVEFILRSGDIDNRAGGGFADPEVMQMGSRLHRKIQKKMGSNYRAEVPLAGTFACDDFQIVVEGRADGILIDEEGVLIDEIKGIMRPLSLLEEPVGVHLAQAKCYAYLYGLAGRAEVSGAMGTGPVAPQGFVSATGPVPMAPDTPAPLSHFRVRMSYANLETEEMKYFHFSYTFAELEEWFNGVLEEYKKWASFAQRWKALRNASIHETVFPFAYREGQKELAGAVYRTIRRKKILFIQAPTGTGKTLSTLFPAVKAVGQEEGERIFYLTARTIARTVAAQAMDLLRGSGLRMKSVILTAKEKICPLQECLCNPEDCPYAKGHFDRVNEALYALITQEDVFDRDRLVHAAEHFQVCPFELSLDLSEWMDVVICDYNYVFDPRARLKRFFGEGVKSDAILLIDEAHNLVDRGREMYSAQLIREDVMAVRRIVKTTHPKLARALERCSRQMLAMKRALGEELEEERRTEVPGQMSIYEQMSISGQMPLTGQMQFSGQTNLPLAENRGGTVLIEIPGQIEVPGQTKIPGQVEVPGQTKVPGQIEVPGQSRPSGSAEMDQGSLPKRVDPRLSIRPRRGELWQVQTNMEAFLMALLQVSTLLQEYLDETSAGREETSASPEGRDAVRDLYFAILTFLDTADRMGEDYIPYAELPGDGKLLVRLYCVDPSVRLQECMDKARSSILFSATLLPIDYYKSLLCREENPYAVYAKSCFPRENLKVLIGRDTTTRYSRRGEGEYRRIAAYITTVLSQKVGNYLAFFPSYRMLEDVERVLLEILPEGYEVLAQQSGMDEADREAFLRAFDVPASAPGSAAGSTPASAPGSAAGSTPASAPGRAAGSAPASGGLLGLCVMGSIFGEGIDLKGDALIGALIVGPGLPMVCTQQEILRQYYELRGQDGFRYAYLCPGMNRVMQAAGRVIRTGEDRGIVLLLDERFARSEYRAMFPREWENARVCTLPELAGHVQTFW